MNADSRRKGCTALIGFVAMLLVAVMYGGSVLGLYALWAMACHTMVTALVGWDTFELRSNYYLTGAFWRSVPDPGESKAD